jgi:hypothetical protein
MKWNRLFLFCLGLTIASSFAMKWMENDLLFNQDRISIFGLELFYPAEKIMAILSGIDERVKTILGYHLSFDFVFMAGVYPGIACLCMMAAKNVSGRWIRGILFVFAFLQLLAWSFDIIENYYLLKWLKTPTIGNEFGFYHFVVYCKWFIALIGVLIALSTLFIGLLKKKNQIPQSKISV